MDLYNSKLQTSFFSFSTKISKLLSPKTPKQTKISKIIQNSFFRLQEQTKTLKKHRIVKIKKHQEIVTKTKILYELNQDKRKDQNQLEKIIRRVKLKK